MSTPATSTRDQSQDSLLEESINLSKIESDQNINANRQSTLNTIDESLDSALGETTNEISAIPQQTRKHQNKSNSTRISTRDGSYDSLLGETNDEASIISNLAQMNTSSQQQYLQSLVNAAIAQKIANRKDSTPDLRLRGLVGETNNEGLTITQYQPDMQAIAEAAITKTIADKNNEPKNNTPEDHPNITIEEEKGKQNEAPKVKNVGFVNYKWTEILVEDEEEGEEIDRQDVRQSYR